MIVQIRGAGFVNKGAELMLKAVKAELDTWPEVEAVIADLRTGTFAQRYSSGIGHLIWADIARFPSFERLMRISCASIPKKFLRHFLCFHDKEVQAVLDVSGYALSSEGRNLKRTLVFVNRCKKEGKKVVLLPQAIGPFAKEDDIKCFGKIVSSVDLLFARDRQSYEYSLLAGQAENLRFAPDFTNMVAGLVEDDCWRWSDRLCVIPNMRMIDRTNKSTGDNYLKFKIQIIKQAAVSGLRPFILVHESNDLAIAKLIAEKTGLNTVDICKEVNPLKIKGIIGLAHSVVGSRFHGLVSALSQGVPAVGTGWSHKYDALFSDYGVRDFLIDLEDDIPNTEVLLTELIDNQRLKARLLASSSEQKGLAKQMWQITRKRLSGGLL